MKWFKRKDKGDFKTYTAAELEQRAREYWGRLSRDDIEMGHMRDFEGNYSDLKYICEKMRRILNDIHSEQLSHLEERLNTLYARFKDSQAEVKEFREKLELERRFNDMIRIYIKKDHA